MEDKNRLRTSKITLVVLAFAETCLIFYLISIYGISINPDSSYYISVAVNIANGSGFVGYNNEPFILQAPLYPILLALFKVIFSVQPLVSAGFLNSIFLGLTIFISGLFFHKHLNSYLFVLLGTISVMVSFVLIKFSLYALSEPLFILLVILFLYYLNNYLLKFDKNSLIIISILAALVCLTRYIGIVIFLSGVITIFLYDKSISKKKLRHVIIFVSISFLPIGLWLIRNYHVSNTFLGQRSISSYTLAENLIFFFDTIINWFANMQIYSGSLISIILVGTFLAATGIGILLKLNKKGIDLHISYPILIFIFLYSLTIIISSTTTAYDHISNRLLSPIYVPVLFVLFFLIDRTPNFLSRYFSKILTTTFLTIIVFAWIYYQASNTITIVGNYIQQSGLEFGSKSWESSALVYSIKNMKIDKKYILYSNAPDVVYILTNEEAQWSPLKTYYNSPTPANPNSNLPVWKEKGKAYLIWFDKLNRKFLFSINELKKSANMIKIKETKDGKIYEVDIN